jgi:hypothetical protein
LPLLLLLPLLPWLLLAAELKAPAAWLAAACELPAVLWAASHLMDARFRAGSYAATLPLLHIFFGGQLSTQISCPHPV